MWLFNDKRRPPWNPYIYTPTTGLTGVLKLVRTFSTRWEIYRLMTLMKEWVSCYSPVMAGGAWTSGKSEVGFERQLDPSFHVSSFSMQISLFFLSRDLNSLSSGKCGCQQFPGFMDNGSTDLRETAVGSDLKWDLSSLSRNWTWVACVKTRNPSH